MVIALFGLLLERNMIDYEMKNFIQRHLTYTSSMDFIDFGNGMTQKSIVKCKVGRSLSAVHSVNRFFNRTDHNKQFVQAVVQFLSEIIVA